MYYFKLLTSSKMVETLRTNQDSMITSESAKNWTEKSPNSKLKNINFVLDDAKIQKIKEVKNLKDKIKNREYRSLQKMIGVPYNRCDGKLGNESLNYFRNHINKIYQQHNVSLDTQNSLGSLSNDVGRIENAVDTSRIQRNEAKYLATHETMNQNEYNKLFSGKEKLQQGQIGDCYLVSGIHELVRAQHFDTLMRTSFQRMRRSNGDLGYQIKIPLGEPSGRKILIKNSELKVAKINGNAGFKLLELAYAKNKLRKNDKQGNVYSPITPAEFSKIKGGWTQEVFTTFLGKNNIGFSDFGSMKNYRDNKTLSQLGKVAKKEICNFLKNYNPSIGNKFVSLASLPGSSDSKSYTVGGKKIYRRHAYSLTGVNKDSKGEIKSIRVLNPWNADGAGNNYQDFTLNEFFNSFSAISCGKIKTKEFLNHKSVS